MIMQALDDAIQDQNCQTHYDIAVKVDTYLLALDVYREVNETEDSDPDEHYKGLPPLIPEGISE